MEFMKKRALALFFGGYDSVNKCFNNSINGIV